MLSQPVRKKLSTLRSVMPQKSAGRAQLVVDLRWEYVCETGILCSNMIVHLHRLTVPFSSGILTF